MKKFTRIMAIVLAVVLSATTLFAFAVSAEDVAGTEYKLGAMGTDNVNGAFKVSLILRETPASMDGFNYKSSFSMAAATAPTIEGGKFIDTVKASDFWATTSAESKFEARVRSGSAWVLSFTAPVAGTYTVSMDVRTYAWASAFASVGNNNLEFAKEFTHNQDDVFEATVTLQAGQTYNVGFSRVGGSISEHVPHQFEDEVALVATNVLVTLDEVGAPAPDTSDATVAVLAMIAVVGTATVIVSKKRR